MNLTVTDGFRDFASQNAIPSTNTQVSGGASFHNFGRTIDITIHNTEYFGGVIESYRAFGDIAKRHNFFLECRSLKLVV